MVELRIIMVRIKYLILTHVQLQQQILKQVDD